eukprot:7417927-Prorocentrum_lima.AAC.1
MAQLVDVVMHEAEERHNRAAQPPTGPTGPDAAGGKDQDLLAAIATFLGLLMENDPQAYVAGAIHDTMKRYRS